jgi:hypothetical protein
LELNTRPLSVVARQNSLRGAHDAPMTSGAVPASLADSSLVYVQRRPLNTTTPLSVPAPWGCTADTQKVADVHTIDQPQNEYGVSSWRQLFPLKAARSPNVSDSMQNLGVGQLTESQPAVFPAHDLTDDQVDPLKVSSPLEVGWPSLSVLGTTTAAQKVGLAQDSPRIPGDPEVGDAIVAQVRPL